MTILDLITTPTKRVSGNHGGEYHGPCPQCGGSDRFHVWPVQGDKGGTYWCRGCGKAGDGIDFLKQFQGLTCPESFAIIGLTCDSTTCPAAEKCRQGKGGAPAPIQGGAIPERDRSAKGFSAPTRQAPEDIWRAKASTFAATCRQSLLDTPAALTWLLEKRGITAATAITCRLGLNSGDNGRDYYRPRASWGLPEEMNAAGKPKKLWIPRGLVIPRITADSVDRLRIRRSDAALAADGAEKPKRYIVVPGSTSAPLILSCTGGPASAWIIVESELDAILLWQFAGDLVGVIAMGNSSARPDVTTHALLVAARHISVALDYDARTNPETGRYENPGGKEAHRFWLATYPQAERTPLIGGKDPCDAWLNGIDLRAWVLAGLPPAYRIINQDQASTASPAPPASDITTGRKNGYNTPGEGAEPKPLTQKFVSASGQEYWITESREEWQRLSAAGQVVFSVGEIQRIKQMMALAGDQAGQVATMHMAAKVNFPGSYISAVEDLRGQEPPGVEEKRSVYQGKFSK